MTLSPHLGTTHFHDMAENWEGPYGRRPTSRVRRLTACHRCKLFMGSAALSPHVLQSFPLRKRCFHRQKVFMFVILSVFLYGRVRPCKSAAACRTTSTFRKNFRQCVSEFTIKRRNVCAGVHSLPPRGTVVC